MPSLDIIYTAEKGYVTVDEATGLKPVKLSGTEFRRRLRAGEEVDMPVFFYLDPEFATDAAMADVNDVTLSYTFFRSDDYDELDDEEEEGEGDARGVRMHGSGVVPVGVRTHAALAK